MLESDFDMAAVAYDDDFTYSQIGKMQRNRVWENINLSIQNKKSLRVLELNCGTGEDALLFSQKGHAITATDISEKMLEVARSKTKNQNIIFRSLDLNKIEDFEFTEKYDLVFSNFGGLNCLDTISLTKVGNCVVDLLKPKGKFIAVIMPSFCFWESLYFLLKANFSEAFRRRKEYAMAKVSGNLVKTWYYSPKHFKALISDKMNCESVKPIGLFIPPSYLEHFFSRNTKLLQYLNKMEKLLAQFSWQSALADHYYIEFKMK